MSFGEDIQTTAIPTQTQTVYNQCVSSPTFTHTHTHAHIFVRYCCSLVFTKMESYHTPFFACTCLFCLTIQQELPFRPMNINVSHSFKNHIFHIVDNISYSACFQHLLLKTIIFLYVCVHVYMHLYFNCVCVCTCTRTFIFIGEIHKVVHLIRSI